MFKPTVLLSLFSLSALLACPPADDLVDAAALDAGASDSVVTTDAGPSDVLQTDTLQTDLWLADLTLSDLLVNDLASNDTSFSDAEQLDAAAPDSAAQVDAGSVFPHPGFGAISGACDVLDSELSDSAPSLFINHLDFATDPYDDGDLPLLTAGGQTMIDEGNANANSLMSEVFAYEMLARCEDAILLKTENNINYDVEGKITDILVEMDSMKIGVSVVRGVIWPLGSDYTLAEANRVIGGKLDDILQSSANVSAEDAWVKQILHVIAYDQQSADTIAAAWETFDATRRADTIIVITVSDGDDAFMY